MTQPTLGAFDAYGIELEYMIVDARHARRRARRRSLLDAMPAARATAAALRVGWSNEIVLARRRAQERRPRPRSRARCRSRSSRSVARRTARSQPPTRGCCRPACIHGWTRHASPRCGRAAMLRDLRGVRPHLRLPRDTAGRTCRACTSTCRSPTTHKFARLLAAVRLVLPLIPALAASSPYRGWRGRCVSAIIDLRCTPRTPHDFPQIVGAVVPEPSINRAAYERDILSPMYDAIAGARPRRACCGTSG